jgi:hypothetical protein
MKPTRRLSRRSFIGRVAGGAIAGGAALTVLGAGAANAQVTDRDPTDGSGHGRGALTDSDSGAHADQPGHGRGPRRTRCSDRDSGDSAGHASHGPTDGDSGGNADAPHCGRGPRRR